MATLFEWLDAINSGKVPQIDEDAADPYKEYVPFQINNGLGQHLDTVLLANEMNKRPWLSKEMQFKFLNGAVSKKKRFGKWAKAEVETNQEDIDTVAQYYEVNQYRAREYIKLLKPEHVEQMRKFLSKGGAETKGKKK